MVQVQLSPSAFAGLFNPDNEDVLHLGNVPKSVLDGSTFPLDSRRFLWHLVNCSPNSDYLIREISQCLPQEFLSACHEDHRCTVPLEEFGRARAALNTLAERFLTDLVLPFRGIGEKTPTCSNAESGSLSPMIDDTLEDEVAALEAKASTNPEAMKTLIALRDGDRCLLTGHGFSSALAPCCTHIVPFAIHSRAKAHDLIELFTSGQVPTSDIHTKFHTPSNALMLQSDAQDAFNMLAWGIEALQDPDTHTWKYYYRVIDSTRLGTQIELDENEVLPFGSGLPSPSIHIDLPSPFFCNLHLSVARLAHLSGASEVADGLCEAWETASGKVDYTSSGKGRTDISGRRRKSDQWLRGVDVDVLWLRLRELQEGGDSSSEMGEGEVMRPLECEGVKPLPWEETWSQVRGRTPKVRAISPSRF